MKKTSRLLSLLLGISCTAGLYAQEQNHCGTTEATQRFKAEHPELIAKIRTAEETLNRASASQRVSSAGPVYIVPIVFHIIHNYGSENISDAQVIDEVRILNRDYRKLNADTSQLSTYFRSIAADCEIEFRLAQKDPQGKCSTGIDRIASPLTNNADDKSKLNQWDPSRYLNVWVVNTIGASGVAGYAYFPSTASAYPNIDGILILANYIGSVGTGSAYNSRALTHEIGHYLNLSHTWGDTNSPGAACGDDQVSDTPLTQGWQYCNVNGAICSPGVKENVQNYMEYSYCTRMFTLGQKARMRAAITSGVAGRSNLWSSSNLIATGTDGTPALTCAPKAEFISTQQAVCAGSTITLYNKSWRATPTSFKWILPGADSSMAYAKNPIVKYSAAGIYDVTLIAINSSGSDTSVRKQYVYAGSSTPQYTLPFADSFENPSYQTNGWFAKDDTANGVTWSRTTTAQYTGTACMKLNTFKASVLGAVHSFISPSYDLTTMSSPVLSFRNAYGTKSVSSRDTLRIYYSYNCGVTWTPLLNGKFGQSALSAGFKPSDYVPSLSQWKTHNIPLPAGILNKNVQFRFELVYQGGSNNLYIDDINIGNAVVTSTAAEIIGDLNLSIAPNPSERSAMLSFSLVRTENVSVKVYDIAGREVKTVLPGTILNAGQHSFEILIETKGIYFIRFSAGDHQVTNKFIVN